MAEEHSRDGAHALRVALLCGSLSITVAHADIAYVQPSAHLYGFYEDNIGLDVKDETSSAGYILRGRLKGGRRSENTDVSLAVEVERRQYFADSDRNTNNIRFDGQAIHRIERDRFELNVGFDYDSTLTSEVTTTGRVRDNRRRKRWYVAPAWRRQLTERLAVNADASYEDVSYDDGLRFGLVDYTFATLGGGLNYTLDERTRLIGRLNYDRYEADDIDSETDAIGVLGGVAYAIDENWSVTALFGVRRADTEGNRGDDDSTGGLFDISSRRTFETGSLNARFFRELRPSGDGLLDTTGLNVGWNQQIVPRWRWLLNANAYRNERPSGGSSGVDRDYFSITPRVRYALDRDWSLGAGYRYRYQKYDKDSDSAEANAVFFTIDYEPGREWLDLDLTR
jgi:hypothetical protein